MTSRPLFINVAESTEIFGPIDHLGWATACAGVTWASSARLRRGTAAGGGQQDPAHAGAVDAGIARAQALEDRAVFAVDRDDFGAGTLGSAGQQFAGQHQ